MIADSWTELAGLWGNSGREVCVGLRRIEARLPFEMLGFDCDNGSEFLNTIVENHLLNQGRPPTWTRSRAYKKNDQAHVEQKNFTHVRQLLGYGRFDDPALVGMVNDLYENAWLPMRNFFTPTMKLVEKKRSGSKVSKTYDSPQTPCARLLGCEQVSAETKQSLRGKRAQLDPLTLAALIEKELRVIHESATGPSPRRRPLARAALRLWSLSLPPPPLRPRQRKPLPKPPSKQTKPTKSGYHESWRNDLTSPMCKYRTTAGHVDPDIYVKLPACNGDWFRHPVSELVPCARIPEEPGAVIPHAGICEGGVG